jgi:hypothetical protein
MMSPNRLQRGQDMPQYPAPTVENIRDYFSLFVNRRAYTIQSPRPDPAGRHNYFLAKEFLPNQLPGPPQGPPKYLDAATIQAHLGGEITIGLYAINPETQRCKWVAIDADYERALYHLCELQYELESQQGIDAALEQSRRGGHLWIFLEQPCLALECRLFVHSLAARLKLPLKRGREVEGLEIFPRHDALEPGQFGNAVRGPLGVHQADKCRYWFYGGKDFSFTEQLAYLKNRRKLTEQELHAIVQKLPRPEPEPKEPKPVAVRKPSYPGNRPRFSILAHVEVDPRRVVSGNYVTRCPSCAARNRDKHGDNLHIKVADTRYYQCRAGCDKYAIRDALGCPIPLAANTTIR